MTIAIALFSIEALWYSVAVWHEESCVIMDLARNLFQSKLLKSRMNISAEFFASS